MGHPSEVDEIFDAISYSKGASVIRMLHDYIGDKDFKKGMNMYLTKFQQKNAATEDLWECLESASGKPIAAVMNTWTKQMGFPLIYVEAEQVEDDRLLKLSQRKFCASGPYVGEDCPQWMVPITISTSEDPNHAKLKILMDKPEMNVVLKNVKPDQWVKESPAGADTAGWRGKGGTDLEDKREIHTSGTLRKDWCGRRGSGEGNWGQQGSHTSPTL